MYYIILYIIIKYYVNYLHIQLFNHSGEICK